MNDNAIASVGGTSRVALGGLAQRLVQDGLLDEASMQDAIVKSKEKHVSLVTHLVGANLATARDIAISASNEFGVPLLDLDAVTPDVDAIRSVSEKLMQKHRVLPLMKRGKRLFLAVADPTNLHALDEIRFQTSMSIEFVVVEDKKLQTAVGKAIDQAEAIMPSLTDDDFDLENLARVGQGVTHCAVHLGHAAQAVSILDARTTLMGFIDGAAAIQPGEVARGNHLPGMRPRRLQSFIKSASRAAQGIQ